MESSLGSFDKTDRGENAHDEFASGAAEPNTIFERTLMHRIMEALGNLTLMRVVTLTILFFLVRVLIRLYQYSLRLAAFWESRSDAVLLADCLAAAKAKRFDDLVNALSPDTYDFNPLPRSRSRVRGLFNRTSQAP